MSLQQSRLLQLPREMRDQIYDEYLWTDEGYSYDFDAGKLRALDPEQRIEFNFMYVCRQVACEMRGRALSVNTITFRTLYSEELRTRAGRWAWLCRRPRVEELSLRDIVPRLKADTFESLLQRYGNRAFSAYLHSRRTQDPQRTNWSEFARDMGEVASAFRQAQREVLRTAMEDPHIQDYLASDEYRVRDIYSNTGTGR